MYAILIWITSHYVTFLCNPDGSVVLFSTLKTADQCAENIDNNNNTRVICIEGVKE